MAKRRNSLNTVGQDVRGFLKNSPERARRLSRTSTSFRLKSGKSTTGKKKISKSGEMLERLEESLELLDEAVQLLQQQYLNRMRACGKHPSRREVSEFIQKWLSEPSSPRDSCRYFRPAKRRLL